MSTLPSNEDIRGAFGGAVRSLREDAGMSQRALSARSGVRPQALSRLERGQVFPRLDTIASITRALQVHPAEPFRRMGESLGLEPLGVEVDLDAVSRDLLQTAEDLTQAGVPERAVGDEEGLLPLSLPERVRWLIRRAGSAGTEDLEQLTYIGLRLGEDTEMVFDVDVEKGHVAVELSEAKARPLRLARIRRTVLLSRLPEVSVILLDASGEDLE